MTASRRQTGLGRGLDALLGDAPARLTGKTGEPKARDALPIEFLKPNREQPRRAFDEEQIAELAHSIRARGLLQPILVRPLGPEAYEIVAGERRWRAAQAAQLHEVPVVIRELSDEAAAEVALIENLQRVDLSALEEARAYQRLIDGYGRAIEDVAKAIGKSRSHVSNTLRLLAAPGPVLAALEKGEISAGHARALLSTSDPEAALDAVMRRRLSVRGAEDLARGSKPSAPRAAPGVSSASRSSVSGAKDADTRALENDLAAALGLAVEIAHARRGGGVVMIRYRALDQLDEVCRRLMGARV
jgi:ParB family chromosome partitioning protein